MARCPIVSILQAILMGLIVPIHTWVIPPALSNGVYEVTLEPAAEIRDQVQVVQYAIDPYTNYTAYKDRTRSFVPWGRKYKCFSDRNETIADEGHVRVAKAMLENWCEGYGVQKRAIVVSVYNSTAWYMCNWRLLYHPPYGKQYCSRREVQIAWRAIHSACQHAWFGQQRFGHVEIRDWNKRYGWAPLGTNICDKFGLDHLDLWLNTTSQSSQSEGTFLNSTLKYHFRPGHVRPWLNTTNEAKGNVSNPTWPNATWSSPTWPNATWSSPTWTNITWSSPTWTNATRMSSTWTNATRMSSTWTNPTWTNPTWANVTITNSTIPRATPANITLADITSTSATVASSTSTSTILGGTARTGTTRTSTISENSIPAITAEANILIPSLGMILSITLLGAVISYMI